MLGGLLIPGFELRGAELEVLLESLFIKTHLTILIVGSKCLCELLLSKCSLPIPYLFSLPLDLPGLSLLLHLPPHAYDLLLLLFESLILILYLLILLEEHLRVLVLDPLIHGHLHALEPVPVHLELLLVLLLLRVQLLIEQVDLLLLHAQLLREVRVADPLLRVELHLGVQQLLF